MLSVLFVPAVNGATLYVSTNSPAPLAPYAAWSNAAHTIQDAIDASGVGDTVLVTNGVYSSGGRPRPGLTHINRICMTKAMTVTSVNGPQYTTVLGNGARCAYLTNGATLAGFTLRDSQAASGTCLNEDTGGGVIMTHGAAVVSNCVVANGSCYCYGGGIYNADYGQAVIANCLIMNNTSYAYAGGVFWGNLYNCTIVGNHCDLEAGGVGQADVYNCIVVDNTTGGSFPNIRFGSTAYTCSSPVQSGTGNIDVDPCFEDGDYRLAWNSPCINAANNGYARGATDLDRSPRISGTVDMGCYEAPQSAEYALAFNGTADYVETPDADNLDADLGMAFTIEAWFRTAVTADQILLAKHNTNLDGSYYLATTAAGDLRFMTINEASNRVDHDVAVAYADNHWHHTAVVYDGTNLHLLFDGETIGGLSAQTGRVNNSSHPLNLGRTASAAWPFYGEIDEVRLWKTARSDSAIRDSMHRQLIGNESNLVLCLRLNEVSGNMIRDWANPDRLIKRILTRQTNSTAVMSTTRMLQEQEIRGAWIGQPTRDPDSLNGLGIGGAYDNNTDNTLWGHNGSSGITVKNYVIGGTGDVQQLNCVWYAEKTGTRTNTTVTLNLGYVGAAGLSGVSAEYYYLLYSAVSSTGVFSLVTNGAARTGTEIAFSNVSINAGYYTLAARGPLETGPATNVLSLTATMLGTVWGWAGGVTNIFFEYGTNTDYGLTNNAVPFSYGGAEVCSVSGKVVNLGPGVTYHYRLAALISNTLIRGADRTFMTKSVKVETGAATNIALWTCTLQGIVNPDGVLATNISFQYGLVSNTLSDTAAASPNSVSSTNDTPVSATAAILAAGTRHYYRLSAMFGLETTVGDILSFIGPITNPVAMAAGGHTYNSFDAAWQGVPGTTNYLLDVSLTNTFENFMPGYENRAAGTNFFWPVTGIVEGVTYYYRVAAQFPEGESGESDIIAVMHPVSLSHYVSPSGSGLWPYTNWACAATQLHQALNVAIEGDMVYAAAGAYNTGGKTDPEGQTNRVYLRKGISLIGNGPGSSFIVGAPDPALTFGRAAVRCAYLGSGTLLAGFTLTNGHTLAAGGYSSDGGGIRKDYYSWGAALVVSNCVITGCKASENGGGVYGEGNMLLSDCRLVGNQAGRGGGAYDVEAWRCAFLQNEATNGGGAVYSLLYGCNVSSNTAIAMGGGLYSCNARDSTIAVNQAVSGGGITGCEASNCVIAGNTASSEGGGLYDCWVFDCTIRDNEAIGNGGGAFNSLIWQCRVENNVADMGGGLYGGLAHDNLILGNSAVLRGGGAASAKLYLNTLLSNSAYQGGGCYGCTGDSCIVVGNTASTSSNWMTGLITYSCAHPLPAGIGNTDDDPLFEVPFTARLASNSPCVDTGNPTNGLSIYDEFDYFNIGRPLDGNNDGTARVDMGCHEYLHAQADSDGDTMLDGWEADHQLYPSIPDDAPLDFDEDGDICSVEHIADTDPWDSNSWFHLQHAYRTNSFAVGFIGSTARVYTLYTSTNIIAGTWRTVDGCVNRPGAGPNTTMTDTNASRYGIHRVGVSLPP